MKSFHDPHVSLHIVVIIITFFFRQPFFGGSFLSLGWLSEMLLYTYTGILLNFDFYGKIVTSVGSAGAVYIASMNPYRKYCELLEMIIRKGKEIDATHISDDNDYNVIAFSCEGMPLVSLNLFNHCAAKLQPVKSEMFKFITLTVCTSLILMFSFSVTQSIESSIELPEVIGEVLLPLFAAGILPLINRIMTSDEEQSLKYEAKLQKLEFVLKTYQKMKRQKEEKKNITGEKVAGCNLHPVVQLSV